MDGGVSYCSRDELINLAFLAKHCRGRRYCLWQGRARVSNSFPYITGVANKLPCEYSLLRRYNDDCKLYSRQMSSTRFYLLLRLQREGNKMVEVQAKAEQWCFVVDILSCLSHAMPLFTRLSSGSSSTYFMATFDEEASMANLS